MAVLCVLENRAVASHDREAEFAGGGDDHAIRGIARRRARKKRRCKQHVGRHIRKVHVGQSQQTIEPVQRRQRRAESATRCEQSDFPSRDRRDVSGLVRSVCFRQCVTCCLGDGIIDRPERRARVQQNGRRTPFLSSGPNFLSRNSAHSGQAGAVRSVPGAIENVPFSAPIIGWRPFPAACPSSFFPSSDIPVFLRLPRSLVRLKTRRLRAMSTFSLRKPAASHSFVMTLLAGLLLHHARFCCDLAGSFPPTIFSISANVSGISARPCLRRNSPRGRYLPIMQSLI
jgi:hypothetical protein